MQDFWTLLNSSVQEQDICSPAMARSFPGCGVLRPWYGPLTLHEQTFQVTLSNARWFIDFSSEGGKALDLIKVISISTPLSASLHGHSTVADCHVWVGNMGCRREASLYCCLVNSFMSKACCVFRNTVYVGYLKVQQLHCMVWNGGGGFLSQIREPQPHRGALQTGQFTLFPLILLLVSGKAKKKCACKARTAAPSCKNHGSAERMGWTSTHYKAVSGKAQPSAFLLWEQYLSDAT